MIKKIIGSFIINLFSLYATSQLILGFQIQQDLRSMLGLCLAFTIIHLTLRPILDIIFKPLNFLTIGLVGLIIDGIILYVLTIYFPQIKITPWEFTGFVYNSIVIPARSLSAIETTVASAFVINLLRSILSWIFF